MSRRWLAGRWQRRPRRRPGRSDRQLGAAVTGLPSGPLRWNAPPAAPPARVEPPPWAGPQVVLGFRDGTVALLDPGSAHARALEELARTLTSRD